MLKFELIYLQKFVLILLVNCFYRNVCSDWRLWCLFEFCYVKIIWILWNDLIRVRGAKVCKWKTWKNVGPMLRLLNLMGLFTWPAEGMKSDWTPSKCLHLFALFILHFAIENFFCILLLKIFFAFCYWKFFLNIHFKCI